MALYYLKEDSSGDYQLEDGSGNYLLEVQDVTVALTGTAATFSAGTITPSSSLAASGQAATFSAGSLTPSASVSLTGQAGTFASGTLTPSASTSLSGQAATFASGTLSAVIAAPVVAQTYSGGYSTGLERQILKRRRDKEREAERAQAAQEAAQGDEVQAELARLLHAQLGRQAELDDLQRVKTLVAKTALSRDLPDKVQKALEKAKADASFSRLQALEREYLRMLEEEEHALLLTLAMLD